MNDSPPNFSPRLVFGTALLATLALAANAAPATATYLREDTTTQGAWNSNYGQNGYLMAGGPTTGPATAIASVSQGFTYTWAGQTTDPRALQSTPGSPTSLAASYTNFPTAGFQINVTIYQGMSDQVAFYLLDWDSTTRSQTITIRDASTNLLLDQRTFTNFHNGSYEVYQLTGNLQITVTPNNGTAPAVSGIFFGLGGSAAPVNNNSQSSVIFKGLDATTSGAWNTNYGQNGYMMANGPSTNPTNATTSVTGGFPYTWAGWTLDTRALQSTPGSAVGFASAFTNYQGQSFAINVNITPGMSELVSLYLLDWDSSSRSQTITIRDLSTNTLLDQRIASNFHNGLYVSYTIKGNVVITVTPSDGNSPVVSGVFFGVGGSQVVVNTSPSAVSFKGLDTTTQGAWNKNYGQTGYMIANGPSTNPANATTSVTGGFTYTWAGWSLDPRSLQSTPGSPVGIATAYTNYQSQTFKINVNISQGVNEFVSLYLLDWDNSNRSENITIRDLSTNTLLDQRVVNNFGNGVYVTYMVRGNVVITVTPTNGTSPAVSGIFFGGGGSPVVVNNSLSSAAYKGVDIYTSGSWNGVYGANGYMIASGGSKAPTYATANVSGDFVYTWAWLTSDTRAPQEAAGTPLRVAAAFTNYQSQSFQINVNINDGGTHRIALYLLDWDSSSRVETVAITDLSTGTLLDTRTFSGFQNGQYALWDIKGNVVMTVTPGQWMSPSVSGVFFN